MNADEDKLFRYSFRGPDGHWSFGRINAETQEAAEKKLRFMGIPFEKVEAWSAQQDIMPRPTPSPAATTPVQVEPPQQSNPVAVMHQVADAAKRISRPAEAVSPTMPVASRRQRLLVDEPGRILPAIDDLLEKHGGAVLQHDTIVDGKGRVILSVLVEYDRYVAPEKESTQ